jgi:hypothetical protein
MTDLVKKLEAAREPLDNIAKFDDEYGLLHFSNARMLLNLLREAAAALTTIERETIERCAKVADAHKGQAQLARRKKQPGLDMGDSFYAEIVSEERGEDIASEIIAAAIRELKP